MNVPTTIVEIRYTETPIPFGFEIPIKTEIMMEEIIENNTPIAVVIIVNEDKSIDFNSFTLTILPPRTSLQIFQAIHQ